MPQKDPDVWHQLRRDKRAAFTVLLTIAAGLFAILAVIALLLPPTHSADQADAWYWALLLPFAWWAASLAAYTPWAVRTLRPAASLIALIVLIALAAAAATRPNIRPWVIAACVAAPSALAGLIIYPRTLLARLQQTASRRK